MIFTNLTGAGLYMQCCHREVAPGEQFIVPWLSVRDNRAVRAAMNNGALAWESEPGEPNVPGSPKLPTREERAAAEAKARAESAEKERLAASELQKRMTADDDAVRANMKRMGRFDVPQLKPRRAIVKAAIREKPVTEADVISDGKPKSLADIARHNRAVRTLGQGAAAAAK